MAGTVKLGLIVDACPPLKYSDNLNLCWNMASHLYLQIFHRSVDDVQLKSVQALLTDNSQVSAVSHVHHNLLICSGLPFYDSKNELLALRHFVGITYTSIDEGIASGFVLNPVNKKMIDFKINQNDTENKIGTELWNIMESVSS